MNPTPVLTPPAKKNLEDQSSWLSFCFLTYLNPLFSKGYTEGIELPDLGPTSDQDRTDLLYQRFVPHWEEERKLPLAARSLWRPLMKTLGYKQFLLSLVLYGVYSAMTFGPVLILNELVDYFQGSKDLSSRILWTLVALVFILPMVGSICASHSQILLSHVGLQMRNILINAVYRKALVVSYTEMHSSFSTGQIVNLFASDSNQMMKALTFANTIVTSLPVIAVALYLVYRLLGVSMFAGMGLIVVIFPTTILCFASMNFLRRKKMKVSDQRIKMMNEVLTGIRIVKYYAWEDAFCSKIEALRQQELAFLRQMSYLAAVGFNMILQSVPLFMPVVIFFTYINLEDTLDAAKAFTAISLFNLIQVPFIVLPMGLAQVSQAAVSSRRILTFLGAEEKQDYIDNSSVDCKGHAIVMKNASFSWTQQKSVDQASSSSSSSKATTAEISPSLSAAAKPYQMVDVEAPPPSSETALALQGLDLAIPHGSLVAVVGTVGCGKSTFLHALLGELHLQCGEIAVDGSTAYCDQQPCVFNDTVRGNILFGLPYDEQSFQEAVRVTCLQEDVELLAGGYLTEIGEKGINLSGGQKARLALARAVYQNRDVYLLDDPLSAVDAHVSQRLFHSCICEALKGKTRILVTHHVQFLPHCDYIIVLENGKIQAKGTFEEIRRSGANLTLITATSDQSQALTNKEGTLPGGETDSHEEESHDSVNSVAVVKKKESNGNVELMTKEEQQEGQMAFSVYTSFIRSGGLVLFFLFLIMLCTAQTFAVLASFWLQHWGTEARNAAMRGEPMSGDGNLHYLHIYAALCGMSLGFVIIRSVFLAEHKLENSRSLHAKLLHRCLHGTMAFFDTTPIGRILNRFSSDLQTLDEDLAQSLSQLSNSIANVLGAVGAIAGSTKGTFLILLAPLAVFYYKIQYYFRTTNTVVARLESISRTPIYNDFSQIATGLITIRAFQQEEVSIKKLENAVNSNAIVYLTQQLAAQWLAMRLDLIGCTASFFVVVLATATKSTNFIPAGYVALGLSYSFQLTSYLKMLVRILATGEAQMNSVERIRYYSNEVTQEQSTLCNDDNDNEPLLTPPAHWPNQGVVEMEGVAMRYRQGPLILKSITMQTKGHEKVGIVGRTGSGKSSLMVALFRMEELAGGKIYIDGFDISRVPLSLLRSRLGIIPQDPVIFSASIRFNLDPFHQYSDEELWHVLELVRLREHIASLPAQLGQEVSEGGDNFSVGQRQLLCIARVLLRKPSILIMDEATASIDNAIDQQIQEMVRIQFKEATVLTIAHRLNTIMDADRVMVLDSGDLKEMGSPTALLSKPDGLLRGLWEKHLRAHRQQGLGDEA